MRRLAWTMPLWALVGLLGCSPVGGPTAGLPQGAGEGGEGNGSGGSAGGTGTGAANGTGGVIFGGGGTGSGTGVGGAGGAGGACTGVSSAAERQVGGKADIIFVLDNSGSMTEEAVAVQLNMNTFSQRIRSSGIDANVVVISSGPPAGVNCPPTDWLCLITSGGSGPNGVCVEPPLGATGACPNGDDTNIPGGYMHWREEVDSNNALAMIQSTYHGWQIMLRPDAAKTFVVVTDDENNPPPTAPEFTGWVDADPLFNTALWRFSGVFCVTNGPDCAAVGTTYAGLVAQTGGIQGDMALFSAGTIDTEFSAVFDSLANAVIADAVPVECEWLIPPPPNGEALDPSRVNVKFTRGDGTIESVYEVPEGECPPATDFLAWTYDNPAAPSRLIACPDTCPVLQADLDATIEVQFGCAKEEPPLR